MEFIDYLNRCAEYHAEHPTQRRGQAYMNALRDARPDLYRRITGTQWDAFYDDDRVGPMFGWLGVAWNLDNPGETE